jgi:hypothetical protein
MQICPGSLALRGTAKANTQQLNGLLPNGLAGEPCHILSHIKALKCDVNLTSHSGRAAEWIGCSFNSE